MRCYKRCFQKLYIAPSRDHPCDVTRDYAKNERWHPRVISLHTTEKVEMSFNFTTSQSTDFSVRKKLLTGDSTVRSSFWDFTLNIA